MPKHAAEVSLNTVSVTSSKANEMPRYTPDRIWDIIHTQVALQFNYKNASADGVAVLTMKPYFYPTQHIALDAKSMEVTSVTANSRHGELALHFTADSLHLHIDFESSIADTIFLTIKYTAYPNKAQKGGSAAITDDNS